MTQTATQNDSSQNANGSAGSKNWLKLLVTVVILGVGVYLAWHFGLFEYVKDVQKLKAWFAGFGIWSPIVFMAVWILACVFFLPGLPITIVGAFIFGPIFGSIYSLVGATLGATAAFIVGRYAARGMVSGMVEKSNALRKIDAGVQKQGWRMLMITRLVPVFPFNAQNFVYGVTRIPLLTYVILTFNFMAPGTVAYNFAAGKVLAGEFDATTLIYLAVAAVLFVLLSLLPNYLKKRMGAAELIED